MKHVRFSKLIYVPLLFALAACQAQATPTASPTTAAPTTAVQLPEAAPALPLLEPTVLGEWRVMMPTDIAFGFDSVWVPSHRDPQVTTRIDPVSNEIAAVIEGTGFRAHDVLVAGDSIWVSGETNDMTRIDPNTNTVVAALSGAHTHTAYGFGSIWASTRNDRLDRIDPDTNHILDFVEFGDGFVDCNNDVIVSASAVWVDHCDAGEFIKIDPSTNSILATIVYTDPALIDQALSHTSVPAGSGTDFIWKLLPTGLLRIDPDTGAGLTFLSLTHVQVGDAQLTVTDEAVWVPGFGQLARVNVASNQIEAAYKIRNGAWVVGVGFDSLWVVYESGNLVQRLDIAP